MEIEKRITEPKKGLMGIFRTHGELLAAFHHLNKGNYRVETVFSPIPIKEVEETLESRPSPLRYFAFAGGLIGITAGLSLASYAHLEWRLITSGKPVLPWVSFFVIAFEGCILGSVLALMIGMIYKNRLLRFRIPSCHDSRFSQNRFGLFVLCQETEYNAVSTLLKTAGAEEIHAS